MTKRVSLSWSTGVGDTCYCEKVRARCERGVAAGAGAVGLSMTDQMCTESPTVEVLSQVQHVNIVSLLGSTMDGTVPCLVTVGLDGGWYLAGPSDVQR